MERLQSGQAVCVLVEGNGDYRLEKLFRAKSEMYKGSLEPARVEELRALLARDPLSKLSQEDIHAPLMSDTLDKIQLAIWRDRGWQELVFASPDSRKPFRESLDPLLRWFKEVEKDHPTAGPVDGPATRCMPASVAQPVVNHDKVEGAGIAPAAASPDHYLFRLFSRHFYQGQADSNCTIVFGDGTFHSEHSSESWMTDRRGRISDGQLDAGAVRELRTILDSPDLKGSPGISIVGDARFASETEVTVLGIPREDKTQHLVFSDRFNTAGNPKAVGGLSNMGYRITDAKLLEPLHGWMKRYTDHNKQASEKKAVGNECAPVRHDGSNKSSPQ
jgi:hypothetical protein